MKPFKSRRRRKTTSSAAPLFSTNLWMLLSICCTWVIHEAALPVTAAGVTAVQTNFGDASFAGGMAYDPTLEVVYVTGQVGPSSCFVGVLKHTATSSSSSGSTLQFLSKQVFSESAVCQTLALRKDQGGTPLLLSVAEEGGLLTDTRPSGSQKAVQYGAMTELQFSAEGTTSQFATERSVLLHQDIVQIPRSIVVDPRLGNRVFVASMTSAANKVRDDFDTNQKDGMPNLTPGGDLKYGSNFAMTIEMLRLASSKDDTNDDDGGVTEARSQWKKPFAVTGDSTRTGVLVNQLIFHGEDQLIVVGSTRGSGYAFGQAPDEVMAGFIAKLDPDSGSLGMSERYHVERDGKNMPTQIEAVCQDESDPESLYVVGSYIDTTAGSANNNATTSQTPTSGANSRIPIVTKFSASNFHAVWVKTFPATTSAYALACGVSQNTAGGSALYVAGVVEAGGEIMGQTTTHLQDDVFVMQLITTDGSALWMKQVGTSGNDRLAHGGSGLVVLEDGGVLLMGDTTGNLYSTSSSQSSEVFIVRVDSQGVTPEASEVSGLNYSEGQEKISISAPVKIGETPVSAPPDSTPGTTPTQPPTSSPAHNKGTEPPIPAPDAGSLPAGNSSSSSSSFVVEQMYFLMAVAVLMVVGCLCFACVRKRQQEKNTERELVFRYLQAFDVEDIDVRHSATGGWHGTYVGKLSKGEGIQGFENIEYRDNPEDLYGDGSRASSDDGSSTSEGTMRSSFSHSSIVKDSLFVDYESKPSYGDLPPAPTATSGGRRRSSRMSTSSLGSFMGSSSDLGHDDDDERSSFVRALNGGDFNLARLSKKASPERQNASDPWGKEIV
ncbi:MAG: hypothetical protein SGILL_002463 [Bacillariaceae sp.]